LRPNGIERYKDYRKALLDGHVIANPKLKQPHYHFINDANTREANFRFDPSRPTALFCRRTPIQEYKLEGAMYTTSPDATEDALNQGIALSIARFPAVSRGYFDTTARTAGAIAAMI